MVSPLVRWLSGLDRDALAGALRRRPETTAAPAPDTLAEVARRLQDHAAVAAAFRALPLPAVQLIEVMQACGAPVVARSRLAAAVGRDADDADLTAVLDLLMEQALVWPDGPNLRMAGPLWTTYRFPLLLGAPAASLLRDLPVAELRQIAAALALPVGRGHDELLTAIDAELADADRVRALLDAAPPEAAALLHRLARHGPLVAAPDLRSAHRGGATDSIAWAVRRGLLVSDGWQHAQLPAEVGLALRGPGWRAPFTPRPPEPAGAPVDPAAVAREAAAAAVAAVERVSAVLDAAENGGIALRKAGGVGGRELRRLGKQLGCEPDEARFWLELAYGAGLVGLGHRTAQDPPGPPDTVLATEAYEQWRPGGPAARLVPLLRAWPGLPTGVDGPPALTRQPAALLAGELRPALLDLLAAVPEGTRLTDVDAVVELLRWHRPQLHHPDLDDPPVVRALWHEAELLGVLAHGALTPLGRALRDADPDSLATAAGRLLPAAVGAVVLQNDLTAVVAGVATADLAALLDEAADRESAGGATTWRFTIASVRAALDAGRSAEDLLARLRRVAVGGTVPQVLQYLVTDTARRHGVLRARPVACVLRCADPALVTELTGVRALHALRLTTLAPTVLASAQPLAPTLAALRAAGYLPVAEDSTGGTVVERPQRRRAAGRQPTDPAGQRRAGPPTADAVDHGELAGRLLTAAANEPEPVPGPAVLRLVTDPGATAAGWAGPDPAQPWHPDGPRPTGGRALVDVRLHAGHLRASEQLALASAVSAGTPVRVAYTDGGGQETTRIIEPLELTGDLLVAWCRLRGAERTFYLDRIESVQPA